MDAIGEGLVLLEGQKHARARKILNPAFKYNKVKGQYNWISNNSNVRYLYLSNIYSMDKGEIRLKKLSWIR